jgi:hypothetical protein
MDFLYDLLKITSLIATAVFGGLGLLTKYKDDEGKITRWGKIALGGIIISSIVSLTLYLLETNKAKARAIDEQAKATATAQKLEMISTNAQMTAEQQKRSLEETNTLRLGLDTSLKRSDEIAQGMNNSLEIQQSVLTGNQRIFDGVTSTLQKQTDLSKLNTNALNEISRVVHQLKDVKISYELRVPDHAKLQRYRERVAKELAHLSFVTQPSWIIGSVSGDTVERWYFSQQAPVAPDRTTESLAYTTVQCPDVELQFFKTPKAPNDVVQIPGRIVPDLRIYAFRFSLQDVKDQQFGRQVYRHAIGFDVATKRLRLQGRNFSSEHDDWYTNGTIIGLPDLLGAQMFVFFRCSSAVEAVDEVVSQEIQRNYELEYLNVSISPGRMLRLSGSKLQKHTSKLLSCPIYSCTFPNTWDELKELE